MLYKLIQGNCIEKMRDIPDNSIHAIITDIPYGISFSSWDIIHNNSNSALLGMSPAQNKSLLFKTRGKPKNGWSLKDKNIAKEFQDFCEKFLIHIERILFPAGVVIAFTGRQFVHRFIIAGENVSLIYRDMIAWDKQKAPFRAQRIGQVIGKRIGDFSDNQRLGNLAPVFEPIVILSKSYPIGTTITDCYIKYGTGTFSDINLTKNLISYSSVIKDKLHETQKPLELIQLLINTFTKKGQIVCDPFMGSGTTGVACINTGRNFIGIELDPVYVEVAKKRIGNITLCSKELGQRLIKDEDV